ncbi:fungal-specific transcription factor domain-containing protein [Talaromyces proteolyticus]|uniref:Fungal-specific transcription factor domain-containing protein n=1 Tax=Talaromyces proteolyticus TaxID=1131652 RepID=A0AAD4KXU3_9EURO|nr:fungal-specific transcription factor domain-containing protein [Talaromyces proteolyticus]KAH8702250.1 fungal-specific transcription factor domain-containing protein [Talaromyces proteolyticus]
MPPSAGPACATCRAKSRRCDRGRPICRRCITKGLQCGGYPDKFRFCGLASRGKWKDRDAPTGDQEYPSSNNSLPLRDRRGSQKESAEKQGTRTEREDVTQEGDFPGSLPTIATPDSTDNMPYQGLSISPSPQSLTSDDQSQIDKILVSTETETLLTHYDNVICPHQIAQYTDSNDNPYRIYVLPLAYEHIGLLYAVLALSACHLGRLKGDQHLCESVAVNYRLQAITALGAAIRKGFTVRFDDDELDSVFATIQTLLLYDICESGISEHGAHISGAMSICSQLMLSHRLTNEHERTVFFLGNLVWLDIVRAFAAPERLCFTQDLRERLVSLGNLKFEAVNGCPRELVLLIGDLLEHAKRHASGNLGLQQYVDIVQSSIQKLYLWDSSLCIYPNDDPLWPLVGEAFRHACILRALRLLDVTEPAETPRIQDSVIAILNAVSKVPAESPLIELMVLPIFMAGVDCILPYSQHYILIRIADIKARSEMSNMASMQLLERVWKEREKTQKCDDQTNVSWMSFTYDNELMHQHDYLII